MYVILIDRDLPSFATMSTLHLCIGQYRVVSSAYFTVYSDGCNVDTKTFHSSSPLRVPLSPNVTLCSLTEKTFDQTS